MIVCTRMLGWRVAPEGGVGGRLITFTLLFASRLPPASRWQPLGELARALLQRQLLPLFSVGVFLSRFGLPPPAPSRPLPPSLHLPLLPLPFCCALTLDLLTWAASRL